MSSNLSQTAHFWPVKANGPCVTPEFPMTAPDACLSAHLFQHQNGAGFLNLQLLYMPKSRPPFQVVPSVDFRKWLITSSPSVKFSKLLWGVTFPFVQFC
jgi:hypothetical protein